TGPMGIPKVFVSIIAPVRNWLSHLYGVQEWLQVVRAFSRPVGERRVRPVRRTPGGRRGGRGRARRSARCRAPVGPRLRRRPPPRRAVRRGVPPAHRAAAERGAP